VEPTWVTITCQEREELVCRNGERYDGFKVAAGFTDSDGQYGQPLIYTEWYDALSGSERPVLRDYRFPAPRNDDGAKPDLEPCQHLKAVYGDV
jgi:hypothetical protein